MQVANFYFNGQEALALLGSQVVCIKPVEEYPIGTSFVVRQIVYDKKNLLLCLDVLLDEEVIDIVGPFNKTQFSELFSYS